MQPVRRHRGFTLIEATAMLAIMAVLATVALNQSLTARQDIRFQQTKARYQQIRDAILKVQTVNGVTVVSGFVADMGRLPYNLRELLDKRQDDPSWSLGSAGIGIGWNGPYLQTTGTSPNSSDAFTDGWGGMQLDVNGTESTSSCTLSPPIAALNGTTYCQKPDSDNYGWNYLVDDPGTPGSTHAFLQSYGADNLPDSAWGGDGRPTQQDATFIQFAEDWPYSCSQSQYRDEADCTSQGTGGVWKYPPTLIEPSDWLVSIGSVTVNIQNPQIAACLGLGGTWKNGSCTVASISAELDNLASANQSSCRYYWDSNSSIPTCVFGTPTNPSRLSLGAGSIDSSSCTSPNVVWNSSASACYAKVYFVSTTCPSGYASATNGHESICTIPSSPNACLVIVYRDQNTPGGEGLAYMSGSISGSTFTSNGGLSFPPDTGTYNSQIPVGQNAISLIGGDCPTSALLIPDLLVAPVMFLPRVTSLIFNY